MELPDLVREYIDDRVLPDYANGYNTAEVIYDIVLDLTNERFKLIEISGVERVYKSYADEEQLVDCYWATPHNKQTIIDYIEKAWKSWEE